MTAPLQLPFSPRPNGNGPLDLVPLLRLRLTHGAVSIDVEGLIDSGATFNVLPLDLGAQFGLPWSSIRHLVTLGGALVPTQAKVIIVGAVVASFASVNLAFAWAASNDYPILLGQANFLFNFDVCLFRRRSFFQIQPSTP